MRDRRQPVTLHDCKGCGGPITRRPTESPFHYNRRRFCDKACATRTTKRKATGSDVNMLMNEDWATRGICAGMDPAEADATFFARDAKTDAARKICQHCPVAAECLTWAVANKERGVWAGTNEDDRGRIRAMYPDGPTSAVVTKYTTPKPAPAAKRKTSKPPAKCGTTAGYERHRFLGETTCQDCCDAVAARKRARKAGAA